MRCGLSSKVFHHLFQFHFTCKCPLKLQPITRARSSCDGRPWPYNRHGPKRGGLLCPFRGELGPRLIQCGLNRVYFRTTWHLHPFRHLATIDMGRKTGGCAPFRGRGAGYPSNTMSLGLRPTSLASDILIHPAIWPQQTWAKHLGSAPLGRGSWVPI